MAKSFLDYILMTDLDGTLLTTDKRISAEDRAAIDEFIGKGGHFTVATGRVFDSAMQYIDTLNVTLPCIMFNGGMIYDPLKKEMIKCFELPEAAREYTKEVLNEFPEVSAEILLGKDIYVPRFNPLLKEKMHTENVRFIACDIDEIPAHWLKILFTVNDEFMPRVIEFCEKKAYKGVDFVSSCGYYYEMLPGGVSKGSSLEKMREMLSLGNKTIIGIGDYNNDIELIQAADIGATVANAPDEVKKAADIVLTKTSDESAIAELIGIISKKIAEE